MRDSGPLEGVGKGYLGGIVMAKLRPEVDLLDGIKEMARRENIQAGVIVSAVGALKRATFRNIKILPLNMKIADQHRLYLDLEQPMELVSLTGWIANKEGDNPEVHAHFSASTVIEDRIVTLGGHLTPGTVTSIKVVIGIGVIEGMNISVDVDNKTNQIDLKLASKEEGV